MSTAKCSPPCVHWAAPSRPAAATIHDLAGLVEAPAIAPSTHPEAGFYDQFDDDDDETEWRFMLDTCTDSCRVVSRRRERQLFQTLQHWRGTPTRTAIELASRLVRARAEGGMTIWTVPTHLPDLRRVDDNSRDRYRRERRGPARRSRLVLAMARRLDLRHIRRLARRRRDPRDLYPDTSSRQHQFRSRPGLSLAQGSHRSRRALRHHERSL